MMLVTLQLHQLVFAFCTKTFFLHIALCAITNNQILSAVLEILFVASQVWQKFKKPTDMPYIYV